MKAKWIYYPGDYELMLFNKVMTRRYERDIIIPPFWRMDNFYQNVKFRKKFSITKEQIATIKVDGKFNIDLDGPEHFIYDFDGNLKLTPGDHEIVITVYNSVELPTIYVTSDELISDESWIVTCNDHKFVNAASENFIDINVSPNKYSLPVKEIEPKKVEVVGSKVLYDFGLETMAFVELIGEITEDVVIHFGETIYEALDFERCETTYKFIKNETKTNISKAFRYISFDSKYDIKLRVYEEYLDVEYKSKFVTNDEEFNKIYEVALRTFHLNTREFFLDGIKRDRWVWAGDAYQSNLMNYYSFFNKDVCKRTMLALLGKEPYLTHLNHIMDYTLFWIIGFYEYVFYTNDIKFAEDNYDKVKNLLSFVLSRCNNNGLLEGLPNDWVFVDWSNLDNRGEVCVEQMLLYKSIQAVKEISILVNDTSNIDIYDKYLEFFKTEIEKYYDDSIKCYRYSRLNGELSNDIRKHPNMFAILYDLCTLERQKELLDNVILNEDVLKITTPYMRFYEMACLFKLGEHESVMKEIKDYWGGMLKMGATSFWEAYDPTEEEPKCYSMYNRPYGKSLCHAWGASPLYFVGRYILGIRPTKIGYSEFIVEPNLSIFSEFDAEMPLNEGLIKITYKNSKLTIYHTKGVCKLLVFGKEFTISENTLTEFDCVKEELL